MASVLPVNDANGVCALASNAGSLSPQQAVAPKHVAFELLFPESPQYRARLPMRVQIYPHDTTDSIVTTVKNFYGLYSGPTGSKGVSFEDEQGHTLIARYENFQNNMVVYVRVIEEPPQSIPSFPGLSYHSAPVGAQAYYAGDGFPLQAPQRFGHDISRPTSRTSRKRSPSPNSCRGRRSASAGTNPASGKKVRSRSAKIRAPGSQTYADSYSDSGNGYSSGDGAPSSASGRTKEHLGNTDISVENIVEGGRRKRAKFESSELPLFAPPQMPAATSNSSVSPARRMDPHRASLSFIPPGQNPFTNSRPLQSPQSYHNTFGMGMYATPVADNRHARGSIGYGSNGFAVPNGMGGILPTPDPTVGSCMSEEDKDVAIQLMRLGECSNISHGRTSASTLDDTFSGRADVASSTGATSDADSEGEDEPPARRQRLDASGASRAVYEATNGRFDPARDSADYENRDVGLSAHNKTIKAEQPVAGKPKIPTPKMGKSGPKPPKAPRQSTGVKVKKPAAAPPIPMSPASLPASRKPSITAPNTPLQGTEEEQPDLSTKPRCQRCRKSKKGCDRQRPCGRCKDAGLSADQCISEDEGNGRKGRYGRHMGVPIKKEEMPAPSVPALLPPAPIAAAPMIVDKNKKRKR